MLTHLLDAELRRIRDDFTAAVKVLSENLVRWQNELQTELEHERARGTGATPSPDGENPQTVSQQLILPTPPTTAIDPTIVAGGLEHLRLFAESLQATKAPDIRVSGVDLGSVLQWLADRVMPKSEHSLMLVEETGSARVLLSGPIFGDATVQIELDGVETRSAKQIVDPVAYHVLATSLRSLPEHPIDLGDATALVNFVEGLSAFAARANTLGLAGQPQNEEGRRDHDKEIIDKLMRAASGARHRNPQGAKDIASFTAFFAGQLGDHEQEAAILEQYAPLFTDEKATETVQLRIEHARHRALEKALQAVGTTPGGPTAIDAIARKLGQHPTMIAARSKHRLASSSKAIATPIRVAMVGDVPPDWLGLNAAPRTTRPSIDSMAEYIGQLAQIVRTLSPNASFSFFAIEGTDEGETHAWPQKVAAAIDAAGKSDAAIIVIPLRGLDEEPIKASMRALATNGKLTIVSAGNDARVHDTRHAALDMEGVLIASSLANDWKLSSFSNAPAGALAVIGEKLPIVVVEDDAVTIEPRDGTGPAAAVLAAIAVETKARYPNLSMLDVGRALQANAAVTFGSDVLIAAVP